MGCYGIDSVRQLQLMVMGLVLIVLMHRRPEGLLGHRKGPAASVELERRPNRETPYADGGETDG